MDIKPRVQSDSIDVVFIRKTWHGIADTLNQLQIPVEISFSCMSGLASWLKRVGLKDPLLNLSDKKVELIWGVKLIVLVVVVAVSLIVILPTF